LSSIPAFTKWFRETTEVLNPYLLLTGSDVPAPISGPVTLVEAVPLPQPAAPVLKEAPVDIIEGAAGKAKDKGPSKVSPLVKGDAPLGAASEPLGSPVSGERPRPTRPQSHYSSQIRQKAKALLDLSDFERAPRWLCRALEADDLKATKALKDGLLTKAADLQGFLAGLGTVSAKTSNPKEKKPKSEKIAKKKDLLPVSSPPKKQNSKVPEPETLKKEWARRTKSFKDDKVPLLSSPRTKKEKAYRALFDEFLEKRKLLPASLRKSFALPRVHKRAPPEKKASPSKKERGPKKEGASNDLMEILLGALLQRLTK